MLYEETKRVAAERERLMEAERAARTEMSRVSALKDEFVSTLSHELRTPLTAIADAPVVTEAWAPAIALTAFARVEDRQQSMASGYQLRLTKPISPRELLAAIAAISDVVGRTGQASG